AGHVDFRAFYTAGKILAEGNGTHLYNYEVQRQAQNVSVSYSADAVPFVYPPFSAVPFAALSPLSYRAAFWTFFVFNIGLLVATVAFLSRRLFELDVRWTVPFALTFLPVAPALIQGQVTFWLFAIYGAFFWLEKRGKGFAAGLVLALALVKFQIALPVLLLYALWRQWRVVQGFAAGCCALLLASLAAVGWSGLRQYFAFMANIATRVSAGADQAKFAMYPGGMPNLHGLFFAALGPGRLSTGLTLACSLALFGWAARQRRSSSMALLVGLLVSYHVQVHDLTLLLLPMGLVISSHAATGWQRRTALFACCALSAAPLYTVLGGLGAVPVMAFAIAALLPYFARSTHEAAHSYMLAPQTAATR
ncbi:MAG: DUF2029 domain-containing protein, partial [Acidobacteriales bacterium]|nr:DUF2029 domain-containing protein [Terriglobales bacterium]